MNDRQKIEEYNILAELTLVYCNAVFSMIENLCQECLRPRHT